MSVQMKGKRIIGAVTWKIGSTISRQCSITGKSSSMGPDVGQYMLTVTTSLQSLREFNGVDVDSIVSVSYTDSAIQSVTFKGTKITLNALVPNPMTSYTFAVQVMAVVRGPRLVQASTISVPGDTRKDCPYDIDYCSVSESSGSCTIDGLSNLYNVKNLYIPKRILITDPDTNKIDIVPVQKIAENAFKDNQTLESISIPDSIFFIGNTAFKGSKLAKQDYRGCTYVSSASNSVRWLTEVDVNKYDGQTFTSFNTTGIATAAGGYTNNSSILEIDLRGSGVKYINDAAFATWFDVKTIRLPSTLRYIGQLAFRASLGNPPVITCTYEGTIEAWKSIHKENEWHGDIKTVQCKDGTVDV